MRALALTIAFIFESASGSFVPASAQTPQPSPSAAAGLTLSVALKRMSDALPDFARLRTNQISNTEWSSSIVLGGARCVTSLNPATAKYWVRCPLYDGTDREAAAIAFTTYGRQLRQYADDAGSSIDIGHDDSSDGSVHHDTTNLYTPSGVLRAYVQLAVQKSANHFAVTLAFFGSSEL